MGSGAPSNRQQRRGKPRRAKRNQAIFTFGAILLFLGVLVVLTWQQIGSSESLAPEQVADPILGSEVASVEIVEYADFGCPACRSWHMMGIRDQILETFGDQVRFVWRDFPVITTQSPKAAEAGHCAAAQGRFWAFHDRVYAHYAGLESAALIQYAAEVGLAAEPFQRCLDEGTMARKVRANEQEARRLGLRGTPGFTVNGRVLPAPPSFAQLADLVRQELAP